MLKKHLKRPSVARVQVEFDLLDSLPFIVWVQSETGTGFWQTIEIEEALPSYCNYCWHIGHQENFCTVKHHELSHTYTQRQEPSLHKEYRPKQQSAGIWLEKVQQGNGNRSFVSGPAAVATFKAEEDSNVTNLQGIMVETNAEKQEHKQTVNSELGESSTSTNQSAAETEGQMQNLTHDSNEDVEIICGSNENSTMKNLGMSQTMEEKDLIQNSSSKLLDESRQAEDQNLNNTPSPLLSKEMEFSKATPTSLVNQVIEYSKGCSISNPFEILSMPSTK